MWSVSHAAELCEDLKLHEIQKTNEPPYSTPQKDTRNEMRLFAPENNPSLKPCYANRSNVGATPAQ